MGFAPLASDVPLDGAQPPAQQQEATDTPAPVTAPSAAPTGFAPLPEHVALDGESHPQPAVDLTDDEKRLIQDYIPKAKDAADLAQFAHEATAGRATVQNPGEIIKARDHGNKEYAWHVIPGQSPKPAASDHPDLRDTIGEGILNGISAAPGGDVVAALLRKTRDDGSLKAFLEHTANGAAADFGPEVGGFFDTAGNPSQYGDFSANLDRNVAHEHAQIAGDSEGHPYASVAGELTGAGLTAPLGGEVLDSAGILKLGSTGAEAGTTALRSGASMEEARAAAAAAARARIGASAGRASLGGTVYGAGSAGPGDRAAGAVVGAGIGAGTDVAAPYVIKAIPSVGRAIANIGSRAPEATPEAIAAAQAAQDFNVDLPAFAVNGAKTQAKAATLTRRGGFGATTLGKSAQTAIDQTQAARDTIASSVGTPQSLDSSLGDDIKSAAVDQRSAERARIGGMFNAGDQQMGDTPIKLKQTAQALDDLTGQDSRTLVPSPVTPFVKQIQKRIQQIGGSMNAADLRASVQNLRGLMSANNIDATTSDHVMSVLRDAMNGDMETAAKQSGNESALQTYQDAREQWVASKALDKTVLKPMLGAAFQNNGDQVVTAIKNAVKNNGSRVAQLFSALPAETANTARASLISRMGTPVNGGPEDYSLSELLKNYNQLQGSRKLIFSPETNAALEKLGSIARLSKSLETVAQNGAKAQPFGLKKLMTTGPAMLGEAASMITHDPKDVAIGTAVSALSALGQWRSAKLLANPDFAKRLASTPMNVKGAAAFWSRPWSNAMAAKNPAIAGEIQLFQKALNDNFAQVGAAASQNSKPQNEQANGTQP